MIPSQKRVESPLSKVPPKKRYCPSGANRDTPVNEAKIILDNRRAFGTIVGLILIAKSSRGPIPNPEKKANPRSIESLMPRFLPLSGVKKSPKASAAPNNAKPIIEHITMHLIFYVMSSFWKLANAVMNDPFRNFYLPIPPPLRRFVNMCV